MKVSLTPELERFIQEKTESGLYQNSKEVIGEALRLLNERDQALETKRQLLIAELNKGLEQVERGEAMELNDAAFEAVKARKRQRRAGR